MVILTLPVLLLLATKPAVAADARDGGSAVLQGADLTGRVYAYGVELTPPYVFSGVDADTMYINGYPFDPIWRPDAPPPPPPPSPRDQRLADLGRRANAAGWAAGGGECGREAAAAVFRASPDVDSVAYLEHDLRIKYRSEAEPITYFCQFVPDSLTRPVPKAAIHRRQIGELNYLLRGDTVLIFGAHYKVWMSLEQGAELLRAVEVYRAGGVAPTDHYRRRFVEDAVRPPLKARR